MFLVTSSGAPGAGKFDGGNGSGVNGGRLGAGGVAGEGKGGKLGAGRFVPPVGAVPAGIAGAEGVPVPAGVLGAGNPRSSPKSPGPNSGISSSSFLPFSLSKIPMISPKKLIT